MAKCAGFDFFGTIKCWRCQTYDYERKHVWRRSEPKDLKISPYNPVIGAIGLTFMALKGDLVPHGHARVPAHLMPPFFMGMWGMEETLRGRILSSNLMLGRMIQPSWCLICQWPGMVIFRVLHTDIVIVPPSRSCSFSLLVLPLVPLGTWWRNSSVMQINFWFLKITVCVWMFCLCENWTRVLWKSNQSS